MAKPKKSDSASPLKQLIAQLTEIAEVRPDCQLSINGEPVASYSLTVLNPVARFGAAFGRPEMTRDPYRNTVLDISTNGREVEHLPTMDYPNFRRP